MESTQRRISRRQWLIGAGALAAGLSTALVVPKGLRGQPKTLKILQWNHFVPDYDRWFHDHATQWGHRNNTQVTIDHVGLAGLKSLADDEVRKQAGHDLFLFLSPPSQYEDEVEDLKEVYQACEPQYGKPITLAHKSTYNPKTDKYFGFSDSYVPDPINYRQDLWTGSDMPNGPDTWEDILVGGQQIKAKHGIPVGIGLASELDSNMALRALLYSFGGSEQDAEGNPALHSAQTLEALEFVKTLYEKTMTDAVFTWDASSNNRFMLGNRCSLAINGISITRKGEAKELPITENIWLAPAAAGPGGKRLAVEHVMNVYVIWKFAANKEGAKQFLVDYVERFDEAFQASEYYNFPCFPKSVPTLGEDIAKGHEKYRKGHEKYHILGNPDPETNEPEHLAWTTNIGYPGFANAAIDEIFNTWVISTMFAEAASGRLTPKQAMDAADLEVQRIFQKWKERRKV